jgi:hypothetical protein
MSWLIAQNLRNPHGFMGIVDATHDRVCKSFLISMIVAWPGMRINRLKVRIFPLPGDVLRSSHGNRLDRKCGVCRSHSDETAGIDYEQVADIMRLTEAVHHGLLWVLPHSASPVIMRRSPRSMSEFKYFHGTRGIVDIMDVLYHGLLHRRIVWRQMQ